MEDAYQRVLQIKKRLLEGGSPAEFSGVEQEVAKDLDIYIRCKKANRAQGNPLLRYDQKNS